MFCQKRLDTRSRKRIVSHHMRSKITTRLHDDWIKVLKHESKRRKKPIGYVLELGLQKLTGRKHPVGLCEKRGPK